MWSTRAQVLCRFERVESHRHAVGAILWGLDGPFSFQSSGCSIPRVRHLYVPPGCRHALELYGQRLMVVLLGPGTLELQQVAKRNDMDPTRVQLLGDTTALSAYARACWQRRISGEDQQAELSKVLGGKASTRLCVNRQVQELAQHLLDAPLRRISATRCAGHLGVRSSRARDIIRAELGVSLQQLRRWQRMRVLSRSLAQGSSLTRAAHEVGFSDSAQLTRDFRATFGVAPSQVYRDAHVFAHHDEALS